MTKPTPPYLFKDNFQEVLTGEFRPKQDSLRRTWTLGQLAHLAIAEGSYETASTDASVSNGRIIFLFNPS